MEILVPPGIELRPCAPRGLCAAAPVQPYQLSFLSVFPETADGRGVNATADSDADCGRGLHSRRRRCRSLKPSDVDASRSAVDSPAGPHSRRTDRPTRFCVVRESKPEEDPGFVLELADAESVIHEAEALLASRFRRGVKILRDPQLLLRFLRMRLVSEAQPVFAVFLLDRDQRLLEFTELARGTGNRVTVHTREVLREVFACNAELLLCARSDPHGYHEPTAYDVDDARRLKRALDMMKIPLVDYVIVGESVTSLVQRRAI